MYGSTYPITRSNGIVSDRFASSGLAAYVRMEFRPEEQASMIFALRRAASADRRRRTKPSLVRRLRSWRAAAKVAAETPATTH
jgi:hypothetical protein